MSTKKSTKAEKTTADESTARAAAPASGLCKCTSRPHEHGVPGCTFARGGDGEEVETDPKTGEMVPEPEGERRARMARIAAAKRGE